MYRWIDRLNRPPACPKCGALMSPARTADQAWVCKAPDHVQTGGLRIWYDWDLDPRIAAQLEALKTLERPLEPDEGEA